MAKYRQRLAECEDFRWEGQEAGKGCPAWFLKAMEEGLVSISVGPSPVVLIRHGTSVTSVATGQWVLRSADGSLSGLDEKEFKAQWETAK